MRIWKHALAPVVGLGSLLAGAANGGAVLVKNPSFESPAQADATAAFVITSWQSDGTGGVFNPGSAQYPNATDTGPTNGLLPAPADGRQVAFLNSGSIWQDVGPLTGNTSYRLTVAVGARLDDPSGDPYISLINGTDPSGTVLGSLSITPPAPGTFQDFSLNIVTGSNVTGDLTIVLGEISHSQPNFDNVRLIEQVPEPSSLCLWGVVSLGLISYPVRKRDQA